MPEELVNEASSVVLVGEAAHPLLANILLFYFFLMGIYNLYNSAKTCMAPH